MASFNKCEAQTKIVAGWSKLRTNQWQGPCSQCKNVCKVPFEPTRLPVLCKTCLKKSKEETELVFYMDGLNYANKFFGMSMKRNINWEEDLKRAKIKVKNFVKAAKKSNISLEVFIDAAVETKETFLKWKSRRERELDSGKFNQLPMGDILLGELFQQAGIKVHFSTVDNDDTMASFAYHNEGNIISHDSDFFRYTSESGEKGHFEIYSDYYIQHGYLYLIPAQLNPKKIVASPRIYLSPPPETSETAFALRQPMPWEVEEFPEIYGSLPKMANFGNRTCLLQDFPNLELTARPLRQALYSRLGENMVRERICTWNFDDKMVEWCEEDVEADDTLDYFLDNPKKAVNLLFYYEVRPENKTDLLWKNHLFAQKAVVAAICAWATGKSMLEIIELQH